MFAELDAQEKDGDGEVPVKDALSSFLTNDKLQDLSLVSKDGVTVRVNRFVLASRSTHLERMIFDESTEDSIDLKYSGAVVKALIDYLHTGKAGLLQVQSTSNDGESLLQIRQVLELSVSALYFHLPKLCRKAYIWMEKTLEDHPSLAFCLLEACEQEGDSVPAAFKAVAKSQLFADVPNLLQATAISQMSEAVLKRVIQDDSSRLREGQLFEILRLWSTSSERMDFARSLVEHIRLECIDPAVLATTVYSSGVVPSKMLLEAFKKQALLSPADKLAAFKSVRAPMPTFRREEPTLPPPAVQEVDDIVRGPALSRAPVLSGLERSPRPPPRRMDPRRQRSHSDEMNHSFEEIDHNYEDGNKTFCGASDQDWAAFIRFPLFAEWDKHKRFPTYNKMPSTRD